MNVSDETLSAFLDAELPEQEMQAVRERLQTDPELADRLAHLAMVDQQLVQQYSAIDEHPMPASIMDLLEQTADESAKSTVAAETSGKVLPFPQPERVTSRVRRHSRMAVAAVLVMAFGLYQFLDTDSDDPWQVVANTLETAPSGMPLELADGRVLTPRLTFESQQGEYCRQYHVQDATLASENIACRSVDGWSLVAEHQVERSEPSSGYQAASGGSVLDDQLDDLMAGPALTVGEERRLIEQHWQHRQ